MASPCAHYHFLRFASYFNTKFMFHSRKSNINTDRITRKKVGNSDQSDMASDQVSRRENTTTERDIYIEKARVPKMTTHFESLAEKERESGVAAGKETPHQRTGNTVAHAFVGDQNDRERHEFECLAAKVGDMNVSTAIVARTEEEKEADQARKGREKQLEERAAGPYAIGKYEVSSGEERGSSIESKSKEESHKEKGRSMEMAGKEESTVEEKDKGAKLVGGEESGEKPEQLSLEEISKLRASAQQNATETIRAAEARYNKAKESASLGINTVADYAKEKGALAKESVLLSTQYAAEKGEQAKDSVRQAAQQAADKSSQAKDSVLQGAQNVAVQAKDTIFEGAKKTSQYISEKGSETKDTAAEKIQHGYAATKDTLGNAGQAAVDYTVPKAEQTKDYALQTAVKAKDTAVDVSKNIASYAGEKAGATKDATMEKGKETTGKAGKVAVDVKDKAVAAGWSAAHYTTEKAVEGTKVAARVVEGVAGYAGHKAVEIAAKPLGAAKDAAAAAGESLKEYTARKKEEAERELEAKRSIESQGDESGYQHEESKEGPKDENFLRKAKEESEEETFQESSEPKKSSERPDTEKRLQGEEVKEQERLGKEATKQMEEEEVARTEKTFDGSAGEEGESQTGVMGAIAETIGEIAHTTKELVIGPDPPKTESANPARESQNITRVPK